MDLFHKLMNILLPPLTLILLIFFLPPFLTFKLLRFVKRSIISSDDVSGKVVLITGAASGIGEQLAYEYGRRGALLVLVDINEENLATVCSKACSLGSQDAISIVADISKLEDCKRFINEAINHFGRCKLAFLDRMYVLCMSVCQYVYVLFLVYICNKITNFSNCQKMVFPFLFSCKKVDHLVNNAGIARDGVFKNVEQISDIVPVMDVNFWGTVYSTHFALPHLLKAKGKIVVIASTCGWYPLPRLIIYNASKAALISFFDTLRAELGWDIGITIVTPGVIKTKLTQGDLLQPVPAESAEGCAKAIVKSACRGDMYLTEPSWIRVLVPLKVFCPELVDIGNRWFSRLKIKSSFLSSQSQLKVE
ncbi:11-beta-hydroxysteroid dehydrogenase-like 4A isoform X1 [Ziziphus jujuba]|uniref:11-beta-hydroxysteroid dehydrogenase-like 4A isoform X1 n=1 Tax=Ziziphus jujuba TaxID=326968 RepID=A0ABM3IJX5_ZIZJJ|nr:11-beta-hydroxysteroid dehydrogenase-like 4A isoform X1 [Ziziphus jujuba]